MRFGFQDIDVTAAARSVWTDKQRGGDGETMNLIELAILAVRDASKFLARVATWPFDGGRVLVKVPYALPSIVKEE